MCIVCDLGRSPTREEIKGNILMISHCQNVRKVIVPEDIREFDCNHCTNLIELGPLPKGLKILDCWGCTSLTEIGVKYPLPNTLSGINCAECVNITELILPEKLAWLYCGICPKLTRIEPQNVIDQLWYCEPNIWFPSKNLENNLKKLRILQRFCRSLRTRKLLRLSRTRKFCEWFYHPENYGGRWDKASLLRSVHTLTVKPDNLHPSLVLL